MPFWVQLVVAFLGTLALVLFGLLVGAVWWFVDAAVAAWEFPESQTFTYTFTPVPALLSASGAPMYNPKNNGPEQFKGRGEVNSPVVGMRNWLITPDGHLTGMIKQNAVWTPGVNTAKCLRHDYGYYGGYYGSGARGMNAEEVAAMDEPDHNIDKCTHGFYAYYDGSRDFHQDGDVTGMIRSVGGDGHEGVIGARGFRVSHAEIVALKFSHTVPEALRVKVRANYPGIPEFDDIVAMLTAVPTSADDLEFVPDADDPFWGWAVGSDDE